MRPGPAEMVNGLQIVAPEARDVLPLEPVVVPHPHVQLLQFIRAEAVVFQELPHHGGNEIVVQVQSQIAGAFQQGVIEEPPARGLAPFRVLLDGEKTVGIHRDPQQRRGPEEAVLLGGELFAKNCKEQVLAHGFEHDGHHGVGGVRRSLDPGERPLQFVGLHLLARQELRGPFDRPVVAPERFVHPPLLGGGHRRGQAQPPHPVQDVSIGGVGHGALVEASLGRVQVVRERVAARQEYAGGRRELADRL